MVIITVVNLHRQFLFWRYNRCNGKMFNMVAPQKKNSNELWFVYDFIFLMAFFYILNFQTSWRGRQFNIVLMVK